VSARGGYNKLGIAVTTLVSLGRTIQVKEDSQVCDPDKERG
jgi:hypothetical protein